MPRLGYTSISSTDQDLAIQIDKLKAASCTVIRSEKLSGNSPTTGPS